MARIKGGMNAKKKHNRVLKLAKGYRGARSKQYRVAKQSVMRALTNLSKQKLNRTALLCLGGNMLLTCLSRGIVEWLVSGVAEGLFTMLVILASLLVMVGSGIGMAYLVQKKNGALDTYEAFSDIMTEEEFEKWKQKKRQG